jgi:hypothetical protein
MVGYGLVFDAALIENFSHSVHGWLRSGFDAAFLAVTMAATALHASRQNLRTVKIVFSKAFFLSKCK